jgi:hypothetical protein
MRPTDKTRNQDLARRQGDPSTLRLFAGYMVPVGSEVVRLFTRIIASDTPSVARRRRESRFYRSMLRTLAGRQTKPETDVRLAGAGRDSDIMPGIRLLRIGSSIHFIRAVARRSPSFARIAFMAWTFSSCSSPTGHWRIYPAG